jgi:hypothetical protein
MNLSDEIERHRTPRGGWTKATLAQWGVPWPPPKGWKAALLSPGSKPDGRDHEDGLDAKHESRK